MATQPITEHVLRYETQGMSNIRELLTAGGVSDDQVDTFKDCLIRLEAFGFSLRGPAIRAS